MKMTKFSAYLMSLLSVATLTFLSSCDNGTDPGPSGPSVDVSATDGMGNAVTGSSYTGFPGDSVFFTINATAPAGLSTVRVNKVTNGVSATDTAYTVTGTSVSKTYGYMLMQEDVGKTISFSVQVVDANSATSAKDFSLTVNNRPVSIFTAVLLEAPLGNNTSETFFDALTGQVFTKDDVVTTQQSVSPSIDFGYFFGQTNGAAIVAPAAWFQNAGTTTTYVDEFVTKNATQIRKTSIAVSEYGEKAYTDVTFVRNAFTGATAGTNPNRATNLLVGEVLAFELVSARGSKRGLIRVLGITSGTGENGQIEIEVVTEK